MPVPAYQLPWILRDAILERLGRIMQFRSVALITLWTMLIGPVLDLAPGSHGAKLRPTRSPGPSRSQTLASRPTTAAPHAQPRLASLPRPAIALDQPIR